MHIQATDDADLALGHRLADAARRVSLSFFRRELRRWSKSDGSLATEADLGVEDELRGLLRVERADDAVLGEERGQTGSSGRRWITDAIDGTLDFAAGGPDWGTLIGLEIDGRVVVGVCDLPVHQRRYWAVTGAGAFCLDEGAGTNRAMRVSTAADLRMARSYIPPTKWQPDARARAIADALTRATTPEPHVDHPALQVAAGGYELAVFLQGGPWDVAALAVIVEEAGGTFTDITGRYDLTAGTAIFSNGVLHGEVLRLLSSPAAAEHT
jgi:histidinol-phosphatase